VNPKGRDKFDEKDVINLVPSNKNIGGSLTYFVAKGHDDEQTDALIAAEAVKQLEEKRDAPFFLAVGFFRPHVPCVATQEDFDLYPLDRISLPSGDRAGIPDMATASLKPLLDDPQAPWKKGAFTQVTRGQKLGRTVRTERWRYTEWDGGAAGVELYDHDADPKELKNLAADPQHAKTLEELKALLAGN